MLNLKLVLLKKKTLQNNKLSEVNKACLAQNDIRESVGNGFVWSDLADG